MTFFESVRKCFRNYAQFRGRAGREEFWWWFLFAFLVMFAASALDELFFDGGGGRDRDRDDRRGARLSWLEDERPFDFSASRARGGPLVVEYADDSLSLSVEADPEADVFNLRVDGDLSRAHPFGAFLAKRLRRMDGWSGVFSAGGWRDDWGDDWGGDDDREPFGRLAFILLLLPGLAVGARRLHDTGRSGWWQLLLLTGVGAILLLFWWYGEAREEKASGYGVAGVAGKPAGALKDSSDSSDPS